MDIRTKNKVLWSLAACSAGMSAIFWLQIGLNAISRPADSLADILALPAQEHISLEQRDVHTAAPGMEREQQEVSLASAADPIRGSARRGELQEWELRKAFSIGIAALGIRAPVLLPSRTHWDQGHWDLLEEQMQIGMLYGTVAYPHSERPGAGGSLFIAGHSSPPSERAGESAYGAIFATLPDIERGVQIVLTDGDERFTYVVTETFVVHAEDTEILAPANRDSLTLITCYPVGTTRQRFVVKAVRH